MTQEEREKLEAIVGNAMCNYRAAMSSPDMGKTQGEKLFELRERWTKEILAYLEEIHYGNTPKS